MPTLRLSTFTLFAAIAFVISAPVQAQDREVPYWASLRSAKVNMRVGPGLDYQVSWVYQRKALPIKVVRLMDGWRLVEDPDGTRGWMLARFLTPERTALVKGETAAMREKPDAGARLRWRLAPGVVGKLGDCQAGWCQLDVGNRSGFVLQKRLWGASAP